MQERAHLQAVISQEVVHLGYEWVGMEWITGARQTLMRIYVDKPGGVTIGDLSVIDRQLRTLLAVECPERSFSLEVSSPGLDRILFTIEQCIRFIGKQVVARLAKGPGLPKKLHGTLTKVEAPMLTILVGGEPVSLDFSAIERIRLVPELKVPQAKK